MLPRAVWPVSYTHLDVYKRQMKVRKNSLDVASRNAKDITQLQEIIRQQAALKQLHISLD